MLMAGSACSVYVGAENGLFKGVDTRNNVFYNFNWDEQSKDHEITSMCWADDDESKVYIGQKNHIVKLFDLSARATEKELDVKAGEGILKSVCRLDDKIVTAVESGVVKVWNENGEDGKVEIDAGKNLNRMRQNPCKPNYIATGGEENDLQIWDLMESSKPVFKAKNVRNDFLDLRVPVWVTDMQFIPNSEKIVTCTRHHHVRLYDPASSQRRPVINMEFENYPLISLALAHKEHQVIVGSSRGRMALLDLRKKAMVHVYKGFAGSISYIQCHPTLPLVASCGLDRFLRLHELNSRKLLRKIYLKSRLNCLLLRSVIDETPLPELQPPSTVKSAVGVDQLSIKAGEDDEDVWNNMKIIKEKLKKRLSDHTERLTGSRKKKLKLLQ